MPNLLPPATRYADFCCICLRLCNIRPHKRSKCHRCVWHVHNYVNIRENLVDVYRDSPAHIIWSTDVINNIMLTGHCRRDQSLHVAYRLYFLYHVTADVDFPMPRRMQRMQIERFISRWLPVRLCVEAKQVLWLGVCVCVCVCASARQLTNAWMDFDQTTADPPGVVKFWC